MAFEMNSVFVPGVLSGSVSDLDGDGRRRDNVLYRRRPLKMANMMKWKCNLFEQDQFLVTRD